MITIRYRFLVMFFVTLAIISGGHCFAEDKFKLKAGAQGELCLKCHETFREKLKERFVHTPVKIGECSGCHNPHTSSHGKLLDDVSSRICNNCHKQIIPDSPRSAHKIAMEGNCVKCHDPHASANKSVLLRSGSELCLDCHKDVAEKIRSVRFRHKPVNEDCLACHNPHASVQFASLLKDSVPSLCKKCHRTDNPSFARQHMNYPVADSRCNSCHDSHGSNRAVIVYDEVHAPVAEKKCVQCHNEPGSPSPLVTKKQGVGMCRACHNDMINETLSKNRVHGPLLDEDGCLHCHNAHAAKEKKLLMGSVNAVCGACHSDTVKLQQISIDNPRNATLCKPVKEGDCIACHSPHSSDYLLLIANPSWSFDVCNKCHEWKSHSTHPIGEKIIDPRNRNLSVGCISCHRACGTGNKPAMSQFENVTETCIQCHRELERR
ncbi:MAG: cytochrome C [Nitrospiraceae bacterium]|nr:MAG: cytochrome C [Nitrospiraceae bacterium]